MRFGLERMRRLLTALGSPQRAFRAIHVVGTNGKSSTVRMAAAILEAHGVRTGAYLSPHLSSFAERIRIGDADLEPDAFGAAVERAAAAAEKVDRTLTGRRARHPVRAADCRGVLRARRARGRGRGRRGRPRRAPRRHQRARRPGRGAHQRRPRAHPLARPTIADIAREKLAVVAPGSTLVVGELVPEAAAEVAKVDARVRARRPGRGRPVPRASSARTSPPPGRPGSGGALPAAFDEAAVLLAASVGHRPRPLPDRRRGPADDRRRGAQPERRRRPRRRAARRRR